MVTMRLRGRMTSVVMLLKRMRMMMTSTMLMMAIL